MSAKAPYNVWMGYDPREDIAYQVARHSIMSRTDPKEVDVIPLTLKNALVQELLTRPIEVKDGKLWCPISQAHMATEFAISRFVVPFIQENGWCLFVDSDIVCFTDIRELFAQADDRYAVMCVKHQHGLHEHDKIECWLECGCSGGWIRRDVAQGSAMRCEKHSPPSNVKLFRVVRTGEVLKMDNQLQTFYARKNWSSVCLFNCDHPAMQRFTLKDLNERPGRDLHAFCWLKDGEIGELPAEWNYLVGVTKEDLQPKLLHYTLGTPNMPGHEECEFADIWNKDLENLRAGRPGHRNDPVRR